MKKKLISMLLAATMAASLFPVTAMAEEEVVSEEDAGGEEDDETAEVVVKLMTLSPIDTEASQHVEDALNEMLLEKINVEADIQWLDASTYLQQVPMMLQASEQVDLMMFVPIAVGGYQSFLSQGQLMDITDLLDEYGQDIEEIMGDYLLATTNQGRIYGVGNMTVLKASCAVDLRKDILDKLGLTEQAKSISSWTELKEILAAMKEDGTTPNVIINNDVEGTTLVPMPYILGSDSFADNYWVDPVGDSYMTVYADPEDNTIKNYYANEGYLESMKRVREFYEEGYIYKDAATSQDYGNTQIKNEVGSVMIHSVELGNEASMEAATGFPDCEIDITEPLVGTSTFTKFGFAVPVTSEEPEAAIKFLNLLYTDQEVMDTLTWGVEGVDWVKNEDGTATYPEGVTADTVQYHTADFLYGNRIQITPWEGEGADIREIQAATNAEMELSPFFGFSVDSTDISDKVTAVKNVIDKYKPSLNAGVVEDVEGTLTKMIAEMDAAGMQDIIAEYQAQLDAWLEQQ